MSYIECYSHITKRNIQYPTIDVEVKHYNPNDTYARYATEANGYNNSPENMTAIYPTHVNNVGGEKIYSPQAQSRDQQGSMYFNGKLTAEWRHIPTGSNPIITQTGWDVNEIEIGFNEIDLFETDTIKISLGLYKETIKDFKQSATISVIDMEGNPVNIDEEYIISEASFIWRDKINNKIIALYNTASTGARNNIMMKKLCVSTELINLLNFNGSYISGNYPSTRYGYIVSSSSTPTSIYDYKNENNIVECDNFVTTQHSILTTNFYYSLTSQSNYREMTLVDNDNVEINLDTAKKLNSTAYRNYISNWTSNNDEFFKPYAQPTTGISQQDQSSSDVSDIKNTTTPDAANYHLKSYDSDNESTAAFSNINSMTTGAISAMVDSNFNPETLSNSITPAYYIPLTLDVKEGVPEPEEPEDPEEPLDPETVEPAVDPETEYKPQESDGDKEFDYGEFLQMDGLEPYNLYRPSYSNFIFKKYYRTDTGDDDKDIAINFIEDSTNPSAFELWGAVFKLVNGHPTPGEIISRVYYLPFEYNELIGESSAGVQLAAPVYGPVGIVTLGAKKYSEHPNTPGEPILDNVHYYTKLVNRFYVLELGNTNITRVFNNFLDFTQTSYKLTLPYGAGQIEIDPDYLFLNGQTSGNVMLRGILDLDTGELTIRVDVNRRLYYETMVNVAVDRLASVEDKMAAPLAIAKMSIGAGLAAGGMSKFFGNTSQSFNSNQTYDLKNANEVNRIQQSELKAYDELVTILGNQIAKLQGGK